MIEIIKSKGVVFLIKRLSDKISERLFSYFNEKKDLQSCTYTTDFEPNDVVCPAYDPYSIRYDLLDKNRIIDFADNLIEHKFNLLGSGLQLISYNSEYIGLEGFRYQNIINYDSIDSLLKMSLSKHNYNYSKDKLKGISPSYIPIDWQRDFRSGFRWDSLLHHSKITYGNQPGVDVKLPWELGRLSHLVTLYYAWKLTNKNKYLAEYKDQIYDFIAFNPPKFGVQWKTSMDIALRAVNLIASYSLFYRADALDDSPFRFLVNNYLNDHLKFIINNLEWSSAMRANHYLANICGLLYLSAFLPVSDESAFIFTFALNELFLETYWQFNPDGGNFEGSLPYHNFASEMVFQSYLMLSNLDSNKLAELVGSYSPSVNHKFRLHGDLIDRIAKQHNSIIISKGKIEFPEPFLAKLNKIAYFTKNTLPQNLNDFQIGDSDDGYFFRFMPLINEDMSIASKNRTELFKLASFINADSERKHHEMFDDFGIYIFRNNKYDICIRCGSLGQNGKGGHAHNDQLSFELYKGNELLICDAGTYNYTALPSQRNIYRSTKSHNTLMVERYEQNTFAQGNGGNLFWLADKSKAKVLSYSEKSFSGVHYAYPAPHQRDFSFADDLIQISDYCKMNVTKQVLLHLSNSAIVESLNHNSVVVKCGDDRFSIESENSSIYLSEYEYSPSYGVKYLASVIVIESKEDAILCSIRL